MNWFIEQGFFHRGDAAKQRKNLQIYFGTSFSASQRLRGKKKVPRIRDTLKIESY